MTLYSRPQIIVIVGLAATLGAGLAVSRWRQANVEIVERLERFDLRPEPSAPSAPELSSSPSEARPEAHPLDLNRATADELARLPGVGPTLAARVLEARAEKAFASVDDLGRVRGFGPSKLERLRSLLVVAPP